LLLLLLLLLWRIATLLLLAPLGLLLLGLSPAVKVLTSILVLLRLHHRVLRGRGLRHGFWFLALFLDTYNNKHYTDDQ